MSSARVRGAGHPDVACDLVAASIVEEYVRRDPASRLDIRVCGGRGVLFISGEVLSHADFDVSAIARRALAQSGYLTEVEPFIAFEQMNPAWGPEFGSREPVVVHGYAQIGRGWPQSVEKARQLAQALERRRQQDEDWFWLGGDYEVLVHANKNVEPEAWLRIPHVDQVPLVQVRERVFALCSGQGITNVRINMAGEETFSGLAERIGGSGRSASVDQFSSSLPANTSGVGRHLRHPLNVGAWLARRLARQLVNQGAGQAIQVSLIWDPLETKPRILRLRNEQNVDLSSQIDPATLDLKTLDAQLLDPAHLTNVIRAPFDQNVKLPWEE